MNRARYVGKGKLEVVTPPPPPPQPTQLVTVKVPIVELGLRNSVEEATPKTETVKYSRPDDEAMAKKFAVWPPKPLISKVVLAAVFPCIKTRAVEVVVEATEKLEPEKRNWDVEEVKVRLGFDIRDEDALQKAICVEVPLPVAGVRTVQLASVGAQVGFNVSPGS